MISFLAVSMALSQETPVQHSYYKCWTNRQWWCLGCHLLGSCQSFWFSSVPAFTFEITVI